MPWTTRDIVLAGSVAVNLVLAGFVVGAGARLAGPGGAPDPRALEAPFNPRAGFGELSPEARRAVREAFVGEGLRAAPLFREIRDARDDFDAAVRADPFDAEGARAALTRIREAERQLQERSNDVMIAVLADLPAEERVQMMDAMSDAGRRFRFRGDDDRRDGPPGDGFSDRPDDRGPPEDLPPQ